MPDFPYINARVRAMRSRLLTPGQLEELLGAPTLEAFMQALSSTPYGFDLQEALLRYEGLRAVDEALAHSLARTTRTILGFADGRARDLISLVLLRWDLANLRVIVRGKHTGRSTDDIAQTLLPAGMLSDVVLKEMAGYPDVTGLAGTLESIDHPLAGPLAQGVAAYAKSKDIFDLELYLDRGYAEFVQRQARRLGAEAAVLGEMFQAEVDAANVKTALKLASAAGLSDERRLQFFVPGGTAVTDRLFLALSSAQTQAGAWERLRAHRFPIKEFPQDLVAFERDLDTRIGRVLAARYRGGDALGVDIVLGYIAMKSSEVANLRMIARGKFLGLPREAVRKEMLVV
jgi:V/A-type H+-transporting ATPase subunit C